jgi:carboxyl-terminal processing protease
MGQLRIRGTILLLLISTITLAMRGADDNDPRSVRSKMLRILQDVSETVEKNFYDPKLKGVDWKAGVETARQRIEQADHTGEMIAAIAGLLARLNDSHTVFIPPGRTEHPLFGFDAKPFVDQILVYDVMVQGPAEAAGLRIGDRILAVNDFKATRDNIDVMMRYFRYLNPNRTLHLTVSRNGSDGSRDIAIEAKLRSEFSQDFSHLYDTYARERKQEYEPFKKDCRHGIIYVKLPSFMIAPGDVASLLRKVDRARTVILDLRENGGGNIEPLRELTGHFLNEPGELSQSILRDKTVSVKITPLKPYIAARLVVLVDSHSASASEMFARTIQLRHRGRILGDRTSGRVNEALIFHGEVGSGYSVYYATEVAVARVVMPDGEGLEGRGVTPDVYCVPTSDDLRSKRDPCLDAALELARHGD